VETVDLVRVDCALIPDDPLFTAVVEASQAITDEYYYNANIIDTEQFPPHLSLHICTVPRDAIPQITADLAALTAATGLPDLTPIGVEPTNGGYVMLNIEATAEIRAMHEAILDLAATARKGMDDIDKHSSAYIRDTFVPHLSLAKVERSEQAAAAAIGRRTLGTPGIARSRTLDLCDIGERSERWELLARF
jgi:2'-5' RNA ligase superfamily